MTDVADPAVNDGARFALSFAGLRRDPAHVGYAGNTLNHEHITRERQIVGLEFSHFIHLPSRSLVDVFALHDVAQGQRWAYDACAGDGRLEHRGGNDPGHAELGVSYLLEKGTFQGDDRKEVAGDVWLRPPGPVELIGRAAYNEATGGLSSQRYVVRLMPIAAVDLAVGYETYTYKHFFQTTLNPVFLPPAIDSGDKVRIVSARLDWEAVKNLTVETGVKNIHHAASDPGDANRLEAGIRYAYNDRKDAGGLSAALVTADLASWLTPTWKGPIASCTRTSLRMNRV